MSCKKSKPGIKKSMRQIASCLAIFLVSISSVAEENSQRQDDQIVTWKGVEIVTNDIELTGLLQNLVNISPGDQYRYSDPRLRAACNRVRNFFPRSATNCRGILMDGATSLYVVEFSLIKKNEPMEDSPCSHGATVDSNLKNLYRNLYQLKNKRFFQSNENSHEFINSQKYLDCPDPELHAAIEKIHDQLILNKASLLEATHSCDVQERALAYQLLNYLGEPNVAIAEAISGVDDVDVNVRNNTMRLISVFGKYLTLDQAKTLLGAACGNINSAEFLDRNKGLSLIDSLQRNKLIVSTDISRACQTRIKYFAQTSMSDQIGRFARVIEKRIFEEEPNNSQAQFNQ